LRGIQIVIYLFRERAFILFTGLGNSFSSFNTVGGSNHIHDGLTEDKSTVDYFYYRHTTLIFKSIDKGYNFCILYIKVAPNPNFLNYRNAPPPKKKRLLGGIGMWKYRKYPGLLFTTTIVPQLRWTTEPASNC
jgi:hypothetical protein